MGEKPNETSGGAGLGGPAMSEPAIDPADRRVEQATRIILRPLANPLPLGFLALGAGTLVVAGRQLDWLGATEGRHVALILLAFVFPLQLIAALFGFLARDVVAATGMGL